MEQSAHGARTSQFTITGIRPAPKERNGRFKKERKTTMDNFILMTEGMLKALRAAYPDDFHTTTRQEEREWIASGTEGTLGKLLDSYLVTDIVGNGRRVVLAEPHALLTLQAPFRTIVYMGGDSSRKILAQRDSSWGYLENERNGGDGAM